MAYAGLRLGHGGAGRCVDSVVQYGQSLRVDEFRLPALIWLDTAVKTTVQLTTRAVSAYKEIMQMQV